MWEIILKIIFSICLDMLILIPSFYYWRQYKKLHSHFLFWGFFILTIMNLFQSIYKIFFFYLDGELIYLIFILNLFRFIGALSFTVFVIGFYLLIRKKYCAC